MESICWIHNPRLAITNGVDSDERECDLMTRGLNAGVMAHVKRCDKHSDAHGWSRRYDIDEQVHWQHVSIRLQSMVGRSKQFTGCRRRHAVPAALGVADRQPTPCFYRPVTTYVHSHKNADKLSRTREITDARAENEENNRAQINWSIARNIKWSVQI